MNWDDIKKRRQGTSVRRGDSADDGDASSSPVSGVARRAAGRAAGGEEGVPEDPDELVLRRLEARIAEAEGGPAPEPKPRKDPRKASYFELRDERMRDEHEADVAAFRRAKQQGILLLGGTLGLFFVLSLVGWLWQRQFRAERQDDFVYYNALATERQPIDQYDSPEKAFGSWRSGWLRMDGRAVFRTYADKLLQNMLSSKSETFQVGELERMMRSGELTTQVEIVAAFENAEYFRIPGRPWANGDLAIFRSPLHRAAGTGPEVRWLATFSYHAAYKEWRFVDLREEEHFSARWTKDTAILPKADGMRLRRYDAKGNEIVSQAPEAK